MAGLFVEKCVTTACCSSVLQQRVAAVWLDQMAGLFAKKIQK